jgi:hypothetical protein
MLHRVEINTRKMTLNDENDKDLEAGVKELLENIIPLLDWTD